MEEEREKYINTEFGKVPSDWRYCTFKDVLITFSSGVTPYRAIAEYYKGKIRWISSGELNYNVIYDTSEHISEAALKNTNLKIHEPGTFLMAITGLEAEGTRGRCAIIGAPSTTNQSCLALNGTGKMTTDYLFWFYRQYGNYLAFKYCQGTKQQSYTAAIVKKLPICCPEDPQEQTAIANALSDTDALIAALDKKIAKKQQIKQGTMQQLLTGKKRLPGFGGEWVEKTLGEVGKINMGQSPSSQFYNTENKGLPLIQGNADIEKRTTIIRMFTSQITKKCDIGDIILSVRAPVGAVAKTTFNACIGRGVCSIKSDNDFLYHYLIFIENDWAKYSKGSTFDSISSNELNDVTLFIPDSEREQIAIAQILTDMDQEIAQLEKEQDKYVQLKAGMMQVLLTGKVRLVKSNIEKDFGQIITKEVTTKSHNQPFEDAALIAAIVNSFYCDKYVLGRKKIQKLLYLIRRKQEASVVAFKRKAAGPYAHEIRYKGGESIAKNNGYVTEISNKKGSIFGKGENINEALGYISKWEMQQDIDWLASQFKYTPVDQLEVLATVDMAICDLGKGEKSVSLKSIKDLISSDKEWKDKLNKPYFNDISIQNAIVLSRELFS